MALIPDQGAVQELAAASADPAFGDRVHAGRPDVTEHGPDPGIGKDCVEYDGEVRPAVADHELDPVCLVAEIQEEVADLLCGPLPGWMQSGSGPYFVTVTSPAGRIPGNPYRSGSLRDLTGVSRK